MHFLLLLMEIGQPEYTSLEIIEGDLLASLAFVEVINLCTSL